MSKLSQLLYVKDMDASESEENYEDMWDDTKLNNAYDKALKIANAEVAKRVAMTTNTNSKDANKGPRTQSSTQYKAKKGQHSKEADKRPHWKVGMPCRAIYEEDGLEYEAVLIKILNNKDCVIRFLGYNNTEVVPLNTLKQTYGKEARTEQVEQAMCDQGEGYNEEGLSHEEYMETETEGGANAGSSGRSCQKKKKPSSARKKRPQNHGQEFQLPELPEFPQLGIGMPMPGPIPNPSFFKNLNIDMPMPPIPPPSLPASAADSEEQAISSMLLSWYMSGYYTGLYRGLRRAKENQKSLNGRHQ